MKAMNRTVKEILETTGFDLIVDIEESPALDEEAQEA